MDDPALDAEEHRRALIGLSRINQWTGVAAAMYRRLRKLSVLSPRPLRVLDIATGAGDLPLTWIKFAKRDNLPLHVSAIDISSVAIASAVQQGERLGLDVEWMVGNALEETLPNDYDVVTTSLFLHHLEDDDIVRLLRIMREATDRGGEVRSLLICDLARSRFNLALVSLAARLLSTSRVVHRDAALSVRAAMTRREFSLLAESALGVAPRVEPLHPCRFIAQIRVN